MTEKPLRQAFYVGCETRMRRLERLRRRLGHTSISETLRWLVDVACDASDPASSAGGQVGRAILEQEEAGRQAGQGKQAQGARKARRIVRG